MVKKYQSYEDLPIWVREAADAFGGTNAKNWVFEPIHMLSERSIIDRMNQGEEGEIRVRKYVRDVRGGGMA